MIVALLDNGSLEPAAHRNLRAVAAAVAERTGVSIHAVSWKHSDRIAAAELNDTPAWTIGPFVRSLVALGQREFVFVPFFVSEQGAIGTALRADLEMLQHQLGGHGFDFSFTPGLASRGVVPAIVAEQVRAAIAAHRLRTPPVVIVDHGGPSPVSAELRDQVAAQVRATLGAEIGPLAAASMEGAHPPLLADQLRLPAFARRDTIVAPLFLSPGRHAGADGDLARTCAAAPARCLLAGLIGTHALVIDTLADALRHTLSTLHAQTIA